MLKIYKKTFVGYMLEIYAYVRDIRKNPKLKNVQKMFKKFQKNEQCLEKILKNYNRSRGRKNADG